ncbi:MAG: histidinol-phosphate transaminase, partial [Clostridia bacterium]|nr:histidinol-phosphate transaminase [Clostridia bacterium]
MSKYIDPAYSLLKEYVPGEQPKDKKYIKLNTNESPSPPSPAVISAVDSAEVSDLRLYSDPESSKV